MLQYTAPHRNTLQNTATHTHCKTWSNHTYIIAPTHLSCNAWPHAATHSNAHVVNLCHQHVCAATHCNALQRTATHCNALLHTHTANLCHTPPEYLCCKIQHTTPHCNTLQHTATHCNTLQHTATHLTGFESNRDKCFSFFVRYNG